MCVTAGDFLATGGSCRATCGTPGAGAGRTAEGVEGAGALAHAPTLMATLIVSRGRRASLRMVRDYGRSQTFFPLRSNMERGGAHDLALRRLQQVRARHQL